MSWFINEVWLTACLAYYKAALGYVGGAHQDTPWLVLKIRNLTDRLEDHRKRSCM